MPATVQTSKGVEYIIVYSGPIRVQRADDNRGHIVVTMDDVGGEPPLVLHDTATDGDAKRADETFELWAGMPLAEVRKTARRID